MPILSDFHLHSYFSGDCNTPMEDMILKAISLGMTYLCFTEHMDPDFPTNPKDPLSFDLDTNSYRNEFLQLSQKYHSEIQLLWGVELGIQPHILNDLQKYVSSYPFDFIIASTHLLYKEDPYYLSFFDNRKEEVVYGDYFSEILNNVKEYNDFDVYGHLDYIVRYGPGKDTNYSYKKYSDIIDEILRILIHNGKGVEINTGGLKYGLRQLHPTAEILKRYRTLGGEIVTVGSDAHSCHNLQNHFPLAETLLKECGFHYYTVFKNRTASFLPL